MNRLTRLVKKDFAWPRWGFDILGEDFKNLFLCKRHEKRTPDHFALAAQNITHIWISLDPRSSFLNAYSSVEREEQSRYPWHVIRPGQEEVGRREGFVKDLSSWLPRLSLCNLCYCFDYLGLLIDAQICSSCTPFRQDLLDHSLFDAFSECMF